jgi:hypothetical protein
MKKSRSHSRLTGSILIGESRVVMACSMHDTLNIGQTLHNLFDLPFYCDLDLPEVEEFLIMLPI